jgi:hypothetical protein
MAIARANKTPEVLQGRRFIARSNSPDVTGGRV